MSNEKKARIEISDEWFGSEPDEKGAVPTRPENWREFRRFLGGCRRICERILNIVALPVEFRWLLLLGSLVLWPTFLDIFTKVFLESRLSISKALIDFFFWGLWFGLLVFSSGGLVWGRLSRKQRKELVLAIILSLSFPLLYKSYLPFWFTSYLPYLPRWSVLIFMCIATTITSFFLQKFGPFFWLWRACSAWKPSPEFRLMGTVAAVAIGYLWFYYFLNTQYLANGSPFAKWPYWAIGLMAAVVGVIPWTLAIFQSRNALRAAILTVPATGWGLVVAFHLLGFSRFGIGHFLAGAGGYWLGLCVATVGCFRSPELATKKARVILPKKVSWSLAISFGLIALLTFNHFFSIRSLVSRNFNWNFAQAREIRQIESFADLRYIHGEHLGIEFRGTKSQDQFPDIYNLSFRSVHLKGLDENFDLKTILVVQHQELTIRISDSTVTVDQLADTGKHRLILDNVNVRPINSNSQNLVNPYLHVRRLPAGTLREILDAYSNKRLIERLLVDECALNSFDWKDLCAISAVASVSARQVNLDFALLDNEVRLMLNDLSADNRIKFYFESDSFWAISDRLIAAFVGSDLDIFVHLPSENSSLSESKVDAERFWDAFSSMRKKIVFESGTSNHIIDRLDRELAETCHFLDLRDDGTIAMYLPDDDLYRKIDLELAEEIEFLWLGIDVSPIPVKTDWAATSELNRAPGSNPTPMVFVKRLPYLPFPRLKELHVPKIYGVLGSADASLIQDAFGISEDLQGTFGFLAFCPNLEVLSLDLKDMPFDSNELSRRILGLKKLKKLIIHGDPTRLSVEALGDCVSLEEVVYANWDFGTWNKALFESRFQRSRALLPQNVNLTWVLPNDPSVIPADLDKHRERVFESLREKYRKKLGMSDE